MAKRTWGVDVRLTHAELDKETQAKLEKATQNLLPQFVDAIAKAHGVKSSNIKAGIKRAAPGT